MNSTLHVTFLTKPWKCRIHATWNSSLTSRWNQNIWTWSGSPETNCKQIVGCWTRSASSAAPCLTSTGVTKAPSSPPIIISSSRWGLLNKKVVMRVNHWKVSDVPPSNVVLQTMDKYQSYLWPIKWCEMWVRTHLTSKTAATDSS